MMQHTAIKINLFILQTHMQTGSVSQNYIEIQFKVKNGSCSLKCSSRRWAENSLTRSMTSEMSSFISWCDSSMLTEEDWSWCEREEGEYDYLPLNTHTHTSDTPEAKQCETNCPVSSILPSGLKEQFRQKLKFCHFLTITSFHICMTSCLHAEKEVQPTV